MKTEKEKEQEREWAAAQQISFGFDIIAGAKQQLLFLEAVDRRRWLYGGPGLLKSIYRYKACWLPLLGKHTSSPITKSHLVVPFDCEWIWHCHRINPLRYKSDCESLFGRILGVSAVVSATTGASTLETEAVWNALYPGEPYEFCLTGETTFREIPNSTSYDLVCAAERQVTFFYQVSKTNVLNLDFHLLCGVEVSREFVKNDVFLAESVERYKGFLHLIRRNQERSIDQFCVPSYDMDLIWHTHQLNPELYCKEVMEATGKIVNHDDTAADRTKGKKLDVGYNKTMNQWETTFGTRYWKAGGMYRGTPPLPVQSSQLYPPIKNGVVSNEPGSLMGMELLRFKVVEVYLKIVDVKNVEEDENKLLVVVSKMDDAFLVNPLMMKIQPEIKNPRHFLCESNGNLCFELRSSNYRSYKVLGTGMFSLDDFFTPLSKLWEERWVEMGNSKKKGIYLRIAVSFTPPTESSFVLRFSNPKGFLGKLFKANKWTRVVDLSGKSILGLQFCCHRESNKATKKLKVKVRISREERIIAKWSGTQWCFMDKQWHLRLKRKKDSQGCIAELVGYKLLKLFEGPKLDYEIKTCEEKRDDRELISIIEFSEDNPYGKAISLIDLKSRTVKINEEWAVTPSIISAFIFAKQSQTESIPDEHDTYDTEKELFNEYIDKNKASDNEIGIAVQS